MPLNLLLRMLLLRADPQDLPAVPALLALALTAHVAANILALLDKVVLQSAIVAAVLDTVLLVALAHTALLLRGLGARAVQTLAALAGTGALLTLAHALVARATADAAPLVVALAFVIWFVIVYTHILRHALSMPTVTAVGASLLYLIFSLSVSGMALPPPEDA